MTTPASVRTIDASGADDVIDVLCDAFADYPVMRYVVGGQPDYAERLRTLVGLFVILRVARNDLLLGLADDDGQLVAAAVVNLPGVRAIAPWFEEQRTAAWAALGRDAEARYQAYGAATRPFDPPLPHHHLGLIGVRRSRHGTGLGRTLLDRVHDLSSADPGSAGVSLTTELARNVSLYEHFGYRVTGHARVAPELETWGFFRPRETRPGGAG